MNSMDRFQAGIDAELKKSKVFENGGFRVREVIGKKLIDIVIVDTGDYEELQFIFEDGKQIEIVRTQDNCVNIQTD